MQNRAIGILGGSFDPIHFGHLHLATEAQAHFNLAKVLFIPCHQNPLKASPPCASSKNRLQMLELALSSFKNFSINTHEINNKKPSYTIDTLKYLRKEHPNDPLAFIMAFDTFATLNEWKDWQLLLLYAHLIVTNRMGYSNKIIAPELNLLLKKNVTDQKDFIHTRLNGYIFFHTLSVQNPISSSTIRTLASEQADLKEWVPESVEAYIRFNHLYDRIA